MTQMTPVIGRLRVFSPGTVRSRTYRLHLPDYLGTATTAVEPASNNGRPSDGIRSRGHARGFGVASSRETDAQSAEMRAPRPRPLAR